MDRDRPAKARYIMLGGFLGAGKTTAIARLGAFLAERGLRLGLISNDQSCNLADTALLRSRGFLVEEITGGCFCCRFDSLVEAIRRLAKESPLDVYVAEPVGSCTDLVATVSYPLRRLHGESFTVAPLSVLVDPVRAARILGLEVGPSFSKKVVYVYLKQLEEADLIVINKCDLLGRAERDCLAAVMRERFPHAEVISCSARDGSGTGVWFEHLLAREHVARPTMELDYDLYAEGEAALGWLNATARLSVAEPRDGNALLLELVECLRARLAAEAFEIAHLKMILEPAGRSRDLAAVSLVGGAAEPQLTSRALGLFTTGRLIINLRAEGDPETVRCAVSDVLRDRYAGGVGRQFEVEHMESFRPARPAPQHRLTVSTREGPEGLAVLPGTPGPRDS
ncbi:MAG: GTP-binding protein [Planctomycetota bacterium]